MTKQWLVAEPISGETIKTFPEMNPVLLQLLWNRRIHSREQMDVFLGPDWSRDTHDCNLFSNMARAVERVFCALEKGQTISIHGDYDADGVCGSAVVIATLKEICAAIGFASRVTSYIPHREKEGYGMSVGTVEHLHSHEKCFLIIAVDCGISNNDAIDRAQELGIDTVVCDHHAMPAQIPRNAILIHPLVPGENYPNKLLCGTGVAFKFACALLDEARKRGAKFPIGHEKWLLDLVAIATVTDVMPLVGENRVLEKFGLLVLNKTRRIGIKKILEAAGVKNGEIDTVSIGFQIGPRLNAAGRMAHASEALELLLESDELRATLLASQLNLINERRQKASSEIYKSAFAQIENQKDEKILIACGEGWGAGLVGLVAGKLNHEFHKPVIVVGKDSDDRFVGSGRSVEGFDITAMLRFASEHLDKFGGHPQACGFSTNGSERFARALEAMRNFANESIRGDSLVASYKADAQIDFDEISWDLFDGIAQMRPFGSGNPEPVFVSRAVKIIGMSVVGNDGKHLRLRLQSQSGKIIQAIGFCLGERCSCLSLGQEINVIYTISVNEWNGNRELQLKLMDLGGE